jgi:hypothetical protein
MHAKLLNALNVPKNEPFRANLSFHPDGYLFFDVPKPSPRPRGSYSLHLLKYAPADGKLVFYFLLVETQQEAALREPLYRYAVYLTAGAAA